MARSWTLLKHVIQYHKGKFDYVMFPRAQKNGYCHYHILTNKYIPKKFLLEKSKKYKNIGFIKIKRNVSVAEYLTKDFFKDNEYVIPFRKRHYNSSKDVAPYMNISGMFTKNPDNLNFNLVNNGIPVIEQYYKIINNNYGLSTPFEILLSHFYMLNNTNENEDKNKKTKTILTQSLFEN